MLGPTDHTSRSMIGPKTRSFLEWVAGGRPSSRTGRSRHHSISSAGGEDNGVEHRRNRHHHHRRSSGGVHKHSSSEGRRHSGHKAHSSSSSRHPHKSSSSAHHERSKSGGSGSNRGDRPGYYTSYSSTPSSAPRDAGTYHSPAPSSSSYSVTPLTPHGSGFVSPSTAPSTIPEENEHEGSSSGFNDDVGRRASTVVPWESVSLASFTPTRLEAYTAAAANYKEPPPPDNNNVASSTGEARPRGRDSIHPSSYDSSSVPPPKYKHGSDVPWEDSVYHTGNGTKASSSYKPSSSKSRQSRPTYTSHDYVYGQQHDPVAACAGDVMKPTYTMNNAYATMPGHGNDSGYVNNSYSYDDGGGDVVGQRDNATYECEEEGERRRVRSTHERKVKRASKSAD